MREAIIAMLSNLGAIDEKNAVSVQILENSGQLSNNRLKEALKELEAQGYLKRLNDKVYLTQTGLFRALSGLS
ncbi:MAG TPA: hypothetical protein VNE86_04105 [Nitrososphaerales archaeon]|nr:hypothetical protein [Nitrososphaerales archaeon]